MSKLGKKGTLMHCSQFLQAGHNKTAFKVTAKEISEIKTATDEAKKAQSEAAKEQALLNVSTM